MPFPTVVQPDLFDGTVSPELEASSTKQAADNLRDWAKQRHDLSERAGVLNQDTALAEKDRLSNLPEHASNLYYLLQLSGASGEQSKWGETFDTITAQDSPGMALYCLYVIMGWRELDAYQSIMASKAKSVPPDWLSRARPYLASLLVRFMPSRLRLLMHAEGMMGDPKVDAGVRANMIQWMGKYLLDEPQGGVGRLTDQGQGTRSEAVQNLIQDTILRRGGVLLIPPSTQGSDDQLHDQSDDRTIITP